ncbi:MAG: hypothetical protein PHT99_10290 [Methanoregula sp.]|nr:hypothetical protein [Methanoregula sp.]
MKRVVVALGVIVLLCLIFPSSTAANITLTTGQQDYYFLTNQPVEISIRVASTFAGEMPGTVRFSTDAQLQKTGTVMISTTNRVFAYTLTAGDSFLNLSLPSSGVSRDYKAHVSFYYTDPSPVNVSLPEFYIHIVGDPGLVKNIPAPLTSSGRPETGVIPASSSVSAVEQTVGTREQMGSDSSSGSSLTSGQPQPGSASEREQQQRDREQRERNQEEFDARLAKDPLVGSVNTSLSAQGFSHQPPDTQPAGNDTGTFSILYRRGAEDRVVVQGSMAAGLVPSVRELANVPVSADPALDANATFRSFGQVLAGEEFRHAETAVNRTLTGAVTNITYATANGNKAYVNATTDHARVIQLSLEQTGSAGFPVIPVVLVAAILAISCGCMYRRYWQRGNPAPGAGTVASQPPFDHRGEAERILDDAERAFTRQAYAEAYGLAGRSLRLFLSYEYGDKGEVTGLEIISLLRHTGRNTALIESILAQCSSVAFARGAQDPEEFSILVTRVREIIRA